MKVKMNIKSKILVLDANQKIDINIDKLYRYMVDEFIEKTEPSLSSLELMRLSPFIGSQLKEILPNPFDDMMEVDTKKAN